MPSFQHGDASIHFDDEGDLDAFPILLIAPGGMRSANAVWNDAPWNPRTALAGHYRLIGMDQRNAGRSFAPITAGDGWRTYRDDQLALLEHLGIERCHVIGMCIGGPYIVGLLLAAPERFASAVLLQPVGIDGNRDDFHSMFDRWRAEQADAHPEADDGVWESLRSNMWGGEFVLTGTPEQVATIDVPMLVAMGNDIYHPQSTSRTIAEQAPDVLFVEHWRDEGSLPATDATIKHFLAAHTPGRG